MSPERANGSLRPSRLGRLPRAGWWQRYRAGGSPADHRTADGAAALCVAAELSDRAQAYRRAEDRVPAEVTPSSARPLCQLDQGSNSPVIRAAANVYSPRRCWIPRLLVFLIPLPCLEPVYWGSGTANQMPADPGVMKTAHQVMRSMRPYTRWSADWLTPWLFAHWPTQPWEAYLAYPWS